MVKDKSKDWSLMGVKIGTATGWDMQDTFAIILYNFLPNETGRKFVPGYEDQVKLVTHHDLCVDWDAGIVAVYADDGQQFQLETDWSVFNKSKQDAIAGNLKEVKAHAKRMKEHV